jgi:hypothetical protein
MPKFAFYMAGVSVLDAGRAVLLLAWDPADQGPSAADNLDPGQIALYSWVGPLQTFSPAVFKIKSKAPISVPAENCPATLDGYPDRDFFVRFGVKPGGSASSLIGDGWLEVFEGSNRVYGVVAPGAMFKVELADYSIASGLAEYSMQDRLEVAALLDPLEGSAGSLLNSDMSAGDLWKELMTPNQPLKWL